MTSVDIALIETEGNVRLGTGDTASLEASIDRIGLLQPIVVAPRGDKYVLIDGHRRLQACKNIGEQAIDIKVYEFYEEPADRIATQFTANEERKNLTAFERAQAAWDLKAEGLNQKDIAAELGISQGDVSKLQKIAKAVPEDSRLQANLFTEKGLTDVIGETNGDPEITGLTIEYVATNRDPIWRAAGNATSYVKQQRFLAEHEELFELLAQSDVDVTHETPGWDAKWFPIVSTPEYPHTSFNGKEFVDTGLVEHRAESCHLAFLKTEYNGETYLIEGCNEPGRHTKAGKSPVKVEGATKAGAVPDPEKERIKKERAEKQARKVKALEWLNQQKMTVKDTAPYVDVAWRALLSNDMAQQFNKLMGLEKVYTHGAYSGTGTMEKYIEDKFDSPQTRMAYVAYLLHAYQYVLPYHGRKELGLK